MRWKIGILLVLILAFAVAAIAHLAYKPLDLPAPVTVDIAPGEGTGEIAHKLDSLKILRSRQLFTWWAKLRGIDRHLQPGRYSFSGATSMDDILNVLRLGQRETVVVTIPEGWNTERISERVATVLDFSALEFMAMTDSSEFLKRWDIPNGHMEGYLLPETYTFFQGATALDVLTRLANASGAVFADSVLERMDSLKMTRHEVLTLASMIEAETGVRDERPRIASVFHNRLKRGMKLQCDPTVIYAMGGLKPGRQLWSNDLKIDSPYNTYKYYGLPPGPICHPGREAIMAVLYPDSTNLLYFVADGTGGHIFSETLREHNRARIKRKQRGG